MAKFDKIYKEIVETITNKEYGVKEMFVQKYLLMALLHIIKAT